ncbi:MAG: hypothetical protein AAB221_04905, partial [Bacteroidota bacterium]
MQKKGAGRIFNSKDGKIGLALMISIVLIFVMMLIFVEAVTIKLVSPGNLTYNDSRNINFTFNATWSLETEVISNCSIWSNETAAWQQVAVNTSNTNDADNITNGTGAGGQATLSYINYTYSSDGNYTWSVECLNKSTGTHIFPSANYTFFIDTVAPQIKFDTPKGVFRPGGPTDDQTSHNITSYDVAVFYVNITDNSTKNVFAILNSFATFMILPDGTSPPAPAPRNANESVNRTMTRDTIVTLDKAMYRLNLTSLLNFSSNYTGPGPHSVYFCANDSLGRITCSNRTDYLVKGGNITQIKGEFSRGDMVNPDEGAGEDSGFTGMDIRYGNGSEVLPGSFFNPVSGNYTFNMNFTADTGVFVVGARIDENNFGNMSRTNYSDDMSTEVQQQAGTGMRANLTWVDIKSFMPPGAAYEFGIIQKPGTFGKVMYCNGTSINSPGCSVISLCNATNFNIFNSTVVIPTNSACWLTSGSWGVDSNAAGTALTSGFTYIFVDHFSGGLGANDFSQPNVTFNTLRVDVNNNTINRSTTLTQSINFTVDDAASTGLNLSMNNSINLTISFGGGIVAFFNYTNVTGETRLSCTNSDTYSWQNTTSIWCNATYSFNSNGTYLINVTGRDTSNISNPINVTTSWFTLTIDQIPPRFDQYNITHNVTTDFTDAVGIELNISGFSGSAQGRTIYPRANWTDNLTQPFQAAFQFFNQSASSGAGAWQTLSTTPSNTRLANQSNWANFSFAIPAGRNEFEGRNVSFRIIANDTLGNVNNSVSVKNFTIQINDTYAPTITINGTLAVNGTNLSTPIPLISWAVNENNKLSSINVSVDGTTGVNTGMGADDNACNLYAFFTSTLVAESKNTEYFRNGSFTVKSNIDSVACTNLTNGPHYVRIIAVDIWGNSRTVFNNFTIQAGSVPGLLFNNVVELSAATIVSNPSVSAVNKTNLTSKMGLNFSGLGGAISIANLSYVSSCNSSSTVYFTNNTAIFPFNESTCPTTSSNVTLKVTVTDTAGSSNSTVFGFTLDNVAPTITVYSPTSGQTFADITSVNVSAFDSESQIQWIAYYLDGVNILLNHTMNGSRLTGGFGQTSSNINRTINFTAGTHRIKISVNDTLGNIANTSEITFVQTGPVTFLDIKQSIANYSTVVYGDNITNVTVRIKTGTGYETVTTANETSTNTFEIYFEINGTTDNVNLSLTEINGSAVNWQRVNFTPVINDTQTEGFITTNWTNTILRAVTINSSLAEFITNNNSYYGVVILPYNISGDISTAQEFWWIPSRLVVTTKTNISQCGTTAGGAAGFSATRTTPCWNYTSGGRTIIQVPYFGAVVAVNDSSTPTVNVTVPSPANQTIGMFVPNITVSPDTASCLSSLNGSVSNVTMTKSGNVCLGQTERFKNLNALNGGYNFTFTVTDASGNINTYFWKFNVSDSTAPNNGVITSSPSTTTATVTITSTNETVNATVAYGTTNTSLGSVAMQTDFNETQVVSITDLTASTIYYYNVTVCDYNGNCKTNTTVFSFTTSAAAATTTTTTSSGSSGGGV